MKNVPLREMGWAVAFVAILLVVYVGSYYAVVRRGALPVSHGATITEADLVPIYSIDGDAVQVIYLPVHLLDRRLRSGYWSGEGLFERR